MKRKIALLLIAITTASALSGCGGETANNSANADVATENQASETLDTDISVTESAETKENPPAETTVQNSPNHIELTARKDKEARSVIINYDSEKVQLSDEYNGSKKGADFDLIGDYDSLFEFTCETASVQELYDETMDGYHGEGWSVTEMRDGSIAGYPAKFFEVLYEGEVEDYYFIMEIDNGINIYNGRSNGYEGEAPFEEMLSYVFADVQTGNGDTYIPPVPYTSDNEGGVFTVTFDSGEQFSFDYDETIMEINTSRSVLGFDFFSDEDNEKYYLNGYISTRYATAEEYLKAQIETSYWDESIPFSLTSIGGADVYLAYNPEYIEGLFYIPLTEEYAILGEYYSYAEVPASLDTAFAAITGAEVELAQGSSGEASSTTIDYGYPTPTELGDDLKSLTYSLDGVVYQFPTPMQEFLNNGWKIPEFYTSQYSEIPANGDVQVALENDNGSVIYNVVIKNHQDYAITLQDGIVLIMIIADDSNVNLLLPEGLRLDSSLAEVEAVRDTSVVLNGDYHTYAWFNDASGAHIASFSLPDTGVEYFEFFAY